MLAGVARTKTRAGVKFVPEGDGFEHVVTLAQKVLLAKLRLRMVTSDINMPVVEQRNCPHSKQ